MRLNFSFLALFGLSAVRGAGLEARDEKFFLDGEEIRLLSGSIHYFRVPHEYWMDRLLKLKASGMNMVETYVAWNLHEPYEGEFNFKNDKHFNLDIAKFIEMAHDLGLMVNLRPGPYICAEWEWGGHPYWLLHDPNMEVRTTYPGYLTAVRRFYEALFDEVKDLMYEKGGPIVMVQIENEYAGYGQAVDPQYLPWLRDLTIEMGVNELLFTCDGAWDLPKYNNPENGVALDGVLWTVNFKNDAIRNLGRLRALQPGMPVMVMEWWTGWFDYWGIEHQTWSPADFRKELSNILSFGETGGSVNYYMFHGGTNFGWMNGANWNVGQDVGRFEYQPVITSYDYDAPLSEHGNMTEKCSITQELIEDIVGYPTPDVDVRPEPLTFKHDDISALDAGNFWRNLGQVEMVQASEPIPMELLTVNQGRGQPYGYALYEAVDKISSGDHTVNNMDNALTGRAAIFVDQKLEYEITNTPGNQDIDPNIPVSSENDDATLSILVENSGRINYKLLNNAYMGLHKEVGVDENMAQEWKIYSLPMDEEFLGTIKYDASLPLFVEAPAYYRFTLNVDAENLQDTFLNMEDWTKGVVWVNGVNLGRYWNIGPQVTLYLPAPFLHAGDNEIIVFEEKEAAPERKLKFEAVPILQN